MEITGAKKNQSSSASEFLRSISVENAKHSPFEIRLRSPLSFLTHFLPLSRFVFIALLLQRSKSSSYQILFPEDLSPSSLPLSL